MSALGETGGLRLQLLDEFKGKVLSFAEVQDQTLDVFVAHNLGDDELNEIDEAIHERAPKLKYVIKQEPL